ASVIALGRALQARNGMLDTEGFFWLTIAFVLVIAAVALPRNPSWSRLDLPSVRVIAGVGLATQLWLLYSALPGLDMAVTSTVLSQFYLGVPLLAVMSAALLMW